jgi:replicative DNA helicase
MTYQKNIHYSPDLETAVLGACMLEKTSVGRVYGFLTQEMFYSEDNGWVWWAIKNMFDHSLPIDVLTITDVLYRKKKLSILKETETAYYVTRLTNTVVSTAHLEYHAKVLQEMWKERELIKLTHAGFSDSENRFSVIKQINDKLMQLSSNENSEDWQDMESSMLNLFKHQDKMEATKGMGVTTMIPELDKKTGGFFPGNFVVLGARPSVGKSAFAGQLAITNARAGKKVGFISLEMSNEEVAARIASIDTQTDFNVIFRGLISDESERRNFYDKVNSSTSKLPIFISDKTGVNIHDIKAKASILKYKHGVDLIIVDYLQLVDPDNRKNTNREQEVSAISRGLKLMAKEYHVPVIALAQLSRDVTKRKGTDRYPMPYDLRESGSLEQDADVIMFLHSDFLSGITVNESDQSTENERDLIVRKWRKAPSNIHIQLEYLPTKMMFKPKTNFRHFAPVDFYNE